MTTQALIFAAGFAQRMRPLTDNLPKPLLHLGSKPLLTHAIDHCVAEGVKKIIINGHHAIEKLKIYIETIQPLYPSTEIILSEEHAILETGGGAVKAACYIDPDQPLFMINGDSFWINAPGEKTLGRLAQHFDPSEMDCLLSLQHKNDLTNAGGDYDITQDGKAKRSHDKTGEYMFNGLRIINPKILQNYAIECFSFLQIMDDCEASGRLGGLPHKGEWYHLSTPQDLQEAQQKIYGDVA